MIIFLLDKMEAIMSEVNGLLARLRLEHGIDAILSIQNETTAPPNTFLGADLIIEALDYVWANEDEAGEHQEMKKRMRELSQAINKRSNLLVKQITVGRVDDEDTKSAWRLRPGTTWQQELLDTAQRWPGVNRLVLGDSHRSPPISYDVLETGLDMVTRDLWPRLNFIHVIIANSHRADPLPPSLASCANLIKKLEIRAHGNLTDLSPISVLVRLECLVIKSCSSLSDISFLSAIAALRTLELSFLSVSDLNPLSSLTALSQLTLGWSPITSISPLSSCKTLSSLSITFCSSLRSLDGLQGCSSLVSLQLDSVNLSSLAQIAQCVLLKKLELKSPLDEGISQGLAPIAQCRLESLVLDDFFPDQDIRSLISSLSPSLHELVIKAHTSLHSETLLAIAMCNQLQALDLHGCDFISNLSPLTALSHLSKLNIDNCTRVTSLVPLSTLTLLEDLSCESLHLSSFTPLSSCTALVRLNVEGCQNLGDLKALSECCRLQVLNCNSCHGIKSLEPLRGLTELRSLGLMRVSRIRDLSPLCDCINLREIKMSHCEKLRGISALSSLKFLTLKIIGKWHSAGPTDDEIDEPHPDDDTHDHQHHGDDHWDEGDGGWDEEDEEGFAEEHDDGLWMEGDGQLDDDNWQEEEEEEQQFDDGLGFGELLEEEPFDDDDGLGEEEDPFSIYN